MNLVLGTAVLLGIYVAAFFALSRALRVRGMNPMSFSYSAAALEAAPARRLASRAGAMVVAYLALALMFFVLALNDQTPTTRVLAPEGYAAAKAGVRDNDRVLAVDGQPVTTFDDIRDLNARSTAPSVRLTVDRGGQHLDLDVTREDGLLGVKVAEYERRTVGQALAAGLTAPIRINIAAVKGVLARPQYHVVGGPRVVYLTASPGVPGLLTIVIVSLGTALLPVLAWALLTGSWSELRARRRAAPTSPTG